MMSFAALTHLGRRVLAWLFWPALAIVVWGELTSGPSTVEIHVWDKALHFTGYFGLALIATLALRANRNVLWALLALIAIGGLLEIVQGMVGRDADIFDEAANTLGVLTGGALGWILVLLHSKLVDPPPAD